MIDLQGNRDRAFRGLFAMSLSVSAIALACADPAWAADAAATGSADATAEASSAGSGEILVTARKRVENLMTTPVSATVLSGDNLAQQNVRNFQDLRGAVSNLELVPLLSGGASFTVRGVGQTSNQVNADSKAGFYVNEMYVSRQEGNDLYFYDVSSLQVLKGPQGTLFGKNTTAGAVLLTTQLPTHDFEGYGKIRVGSYKRVELEGALNVPLADGLFGRVSFRTQDADGYIKHLLDNGRSGNINNKSVRAQLRWESGALTADLLGEYNASHTDGGATIATACRTDSYTKNYNALHSVDYCDKYPIIGKDYTVYGGATLGAPTSSAITDEAVGGDANSGKNRYIGKGPFNDTDVWTINGRLNYALTDDIAIHSVTAYRRSHAEWYTPTLDAPDDIYAEYDNTKTKQFSQELTLGGSAIDGRLNFIGGLYYYNQKTTFLQDTGPDWIDPLGYVYDADVKYKSFAAFLQGSFKITPKLELTVGGRYTHDHKSGNSYVFYAGNGATYVDANGATQTCGWFIGDFLGGLANCAGAPYTASGSKSWNSFDPKVQLSYQWSDSVYTYMTAAHGYNAGGFNQQLGGQPADGRFPSNYNPEKLWSYEGGVKLDLLDHRFLISASGFYQKYSDIQSTILVTIGNITSRQFATAATAHEAGFEAEFVLRPTERLTLRGNGSYLEQGYDKIVSGALIDKETPVNSAPKYQFSAAVSYDFDVGANGVLTPSADVRGIGKKPACYTSGTATAPQRATCNLPAYALVGFRLDYVPSRDSAWRIGVYGTNVFDKVIQLTRSGYLSGGMGIDRYTPGRPQEFGVEASYRF
ncbi:TonB-dependent receptor [Flavisphingomonas formosensis]|uniref:TonB-dependent receptor n=1 Tax=Flavisphingomonas formosensis TaxID=861534 RepID=UPI001E51150C|nr:TonB-dependent receptor [Sphingomonas formosensis]